MASDNGHLSIFNMKYRPTWTASKKKRVQISAIVNTGLLGFILTVAVHK